MFLVAISIDDLKIANIYKPPNSPWSIEILTVYQHPAVYVGDFNSHHTLWRYQTDDDNGLKLADCADINHLSLIFDAKDRETLHSRRWLRDYNPDLCFASSNHDERQQQVSRRVLLDFPEANTAQLS